MHGPSQVNNNANNQTTFIPLSGGLTLLKETRYPETQIPKSIDTGYVVTSFFHSAWQIGHSLFDEFANANASLHSTA